MEINRFLCQSKLAIEMVKRYCWWDSNRNSQVKYGENVKTVIAACVGRTTGRNARSAAQPAAMFSRPYGPWNSLFKIASNAPKTSWIKSKGCQARPRRPAPWKPLRETGIAIDSEPRNSTVLQRKSPSDSDETAEMPWRDHQAPLRRPPMACLPDSATDSASLTRSLPAWLFTKNRLKYDYRA